METILDKNMVARLSLNALLKEPDRFDILFPNIKDSDILYGYKFYVFKDKFDIWWNEDRFFPKQPMAEDLTILKNFIKNMSDLTDKWFSDNYSLHCLIMLNFLCYIGCQNIVINTLMFGGIQYLNLCMRIT